MEADQNTIGLLSFRYWLAQETHYNLDQGRSELAGALGFIEIWILRSFQFGNLRLRAFVSLHHHGTVPRSGRKALTPEQ
jgi:hypothetical protein